MGFVKHFDPIAVTPLLCTSEEETTGTGTCTMYIEIGRLAFIKLKKCKKTLQLSSVG
jgi:hypothetical protein